jgi:LUD domain
VDDGAAAKAEVLSRLPEGAEVHSGKSKTLEDAGIYQELMESDRYDFLRKRIFKMDRATQGDQIRKLGAGPDYQLGSAQAVTEDGQVLIASASGSQIGPISAGAGKVILVVGSQKIVPDLDAALRRIRDHVFPYEDARLRKQMGVPTKLTRILILEQADYVAGRSTMVLVRQPIGV